MALDPTSAPAAPPAPTYTASALPMAAPRRARILAVTSGKGGVGKTMVSANLAAALSRAGQKVLVLDADLGLANLDVVLNLPVKVTLHDVITGQKPLSQALIQASAGFHVLLAGSGMVEYSRLTPDLRDRLAALLQEASQHFDLIILDTGAGISDVVLYTIALADEVLVVATPEPTSLTDAYATIKVLATLQGRRSLMVLINQATKPGEGLTIGHQLQAVVQRYLQGALNDPLQLRLLGELPLDDSARDAVRRRALVTQLWPGAEVSRGLTAVAQRLQKWLQNPAVTA